MWGRIVAEDVGRVVQPENNKEAEPENGGRDLPHAGEIGGGETENHDDDVVVAADFRDDSGETARQKESDEKTEEVRT